jgi:hypothetical protein
MMYTTRNVIWRWVAVLSLLAVFASVQPGWTVPQIDNSTITNKILCGFQGWFSCLEDGGGNWTHWADDSSWIGPTNYHTDIWPDVTEYDPSDLYFVPNTTLTQGGTPYLFSDHSQTAINVQFRWMLENQIDGVLLQRFVVGCPHNYSNDDIHRYVINACNTYGRVYAIEYDASGTASSELFNRITGDWSFIETTFDPAGNLRYLRHNGKPVVSIWGIGVDPNQSPQTWQQIISWLKSKGCTVMGGVPGGWRTMTDPGWHDVFRSLDIIQPWTVGGYNDWAGINNYKTYTAAPDLAECNSLGIVFMPVAWPRGGWDNMHDYPCGQSKVSPRLGQHLWDQLYAYKSIGAPCQKIAMYDEYDESTAIMKLSDNVPVDGCFWTREGMPSDWWLRLANQGSKMQRGEIACSQTIPISPTGSPDYASIVSETIPATMNLGQQYPVSITVQNIGESCWNAEFFKLGAVGNWDPFTTTTKYALATGTTVTPTQQYTFNFTMKAPGHNGAYLADWEMSHELIRMFPAKVMKLVTVGTGPAMQVSSAFGSNTDGWSTTTWRAGTTSYGTMGYSSSAGNPSGGGLRCVGAGISTTDSADRCLREGGEAAKTISTVGYRGIIVGYDVKVGSLGGNYTGPGTGTCTVDHNIIDEQLTVYYSTNAGATWTEADCVQRQELLANYSSYGTRYIDLSGIPACDNNANFRLKFRWQLNTSGDYGYLDNIRVMGNIFDVTPPGPVTGLAGTGGNRHVALTWTNPSDPDFNGTIVRYRTDTYPTSMTDGTLLTDKTGLPGASDSYIHIGLTDGRTYYYAVFAHDDSSLVSSRMTTSGTPMGTVADWVDEPFDGYVDGYLGGLRWAAVGADGARVQSAQAKGGTGKACLMDTVPTGLSIANEITVTDKTTGYVYVSFDLCQDTAGTNGQTAGCITVYGSGSATEITQILIQKNRLVAGYGQSSLAVLSASQANLTWYNVKIGLNIDTRSMDFWLDGVSKGTGYAWRGAPTGVSRIVISSDRNTSLTTQRVYLDNMKLEPRLGVVTQVRDDGEWTPSLSKLHFGFDPASYTSQYRYCIGTTPGGSQARGWTVCGTSTDVMSTGLTLSENVTYYVTVQCGDQNGNWGSSRTSDGIKVAPGITDINYAKAMADGAPTAVKSLRGKLVSAAFPGYFYIQEPDCPAGIRVVCGFPASAGDQMDVCGVIKGSGAERYLEIAGSGVIRTTPGPGGPYPVTMTTLSVGGADLNAYTPGVMGPVGPNNIGLLITVVGRVTAKDPSSQYFYIDDGNGLRDGTTTGGIDNSGLRVIADPSSYAIGSYVAVKGISSIFSDGGHLKRRVLAAQIQILGP